MLARVFPLKAFLLCLGLLIASCTVPTNDAKAGKPIIDGYHDYAAVRVELEALAKHKHAKLSSLGQTHGGREIFLLTLSNGESNKKPAILLVGNVSAPRLVGSELALRMAKDILARSEKDERIKKLLQEQTLYIIPRPTPDASEAFFQPPYQEREGNVRATDDDHDGDINEDPNEDLNGDGFITMMRIEDPNGKYIVHPEDPRVMIIADPLKGEKGKYRLLTEGKDNDHDESFNEDGPGGVYFNRNFTFRYPYFTKGSGPNQVSEPETRAVADFAFKHPNITTILSFTPHDNMASAWKGKGKASTPRMSSTVQASDVKYMDAIRKKYQKLIKTTKTSSPDSAGSFAHWAYFHFGRWTIATPGWYMPEIKEDTASTSKEKPEDKTDKTKKASKPADAKKPATKSDKKSRTTKKVAEKRGAKEIAALRWMKHNNIDGFQAWKEFKHPDFPNKKVEIGGFRPFIRINPPAKQLDVLAAKHVDFLADLSAMKPALELSLEKIERQGNGIVRVVVNIRNTGFLPTLSTMGEKSRLHIRTQAELVLPQGYTLVTGSLRRSLSKLEGSGGHTQQEWLLMLPKNSSSRKLLLKVGSPTLGEKTLEIEIPAP